MKQLSRGYTVVGATVMMLSTQVQAATLQCSDIAGLVGVLSMHHYAAEQISQDELRSRTVDRFIREIDPGQTLLLTSDVEKLERKLLPAFDNVRRGNCSALSAAADIALKRSEEDVQFVKKILGDDYKLDESVELILDPRKRGYAQTEAERRKLVTKMVHFQISNYLLTKMDMAKAKKQLIHRYDLAASRLRKRFKGGKLPEIYAEAFANALDPHTAFMSTETLEDFQIQMRLSLEGIGAVLSSQDGLTVIESLVPGGQAERVNMLKPKDKIIAVAQEGESPVSTIDMELQEVVKMIRGPKGTQVTLTILRDGASTKTFDVTIVRDKIDVKQQAAKISYETRTVGQRQLKIGVLDLPSFYGDSTEGGRSSYADVKQLLDEARLEKVDGLVLDLSRNGGGLLEDAVRISGLFIRRGSVVATRNSGGKVDVLSDLDDGVAYNGPLVVLTSPASASASEILAGALQDYDRAVIVGGEHTFGKGTVQALLPLPRSLGAVKVTTAMFFLPGGVSTQQRGVASDIRVPSVLDGMELGDKMLDYSLAPQTMKAFASSQANAADPHRHYTPITDIMIKMLAEKSKARVATSNEFADIQKLLEERANNKGRVKLADLRDNARRGANEAQKREAKADEAQPKTDTKMNADSKAPSKGSEPKDKDDRPKEGHHGGSDDDGDDDKLNEVTRQEAVNIVADLAAMS